MSRAHVESNQGTHEQRGGIDKANVPLLPSSFDDGDDDDDDESDSPRPRSTADFARLPATPPTVTASADDAADVVVVVVVAAKRGAKARTPPTSNRSMMTVLKREELACEDCCFRFARRVGGDAAGATGILGVGYLCVYVDV